MENKDKVKDWSNKHLQEYVEKQITAMFESILDYTEVAVPEEPRYKVVRSKILRVSNDTIRGIKSELSRNYDIRFKGIRQEVVRIKQGRDK